MQRFPRTDLKADSQVIKAPFDAYAVEIVPVFSGGEIFADSTEHDMYAAIDLLIDKLDRQILKHKEKIKAHHK